MTGRERVLRAVSHEEPDRIPLDLGGTVDTGIHYVAYGKLLDHLGMSEHMRTLDGIPFFDIVTGVVEVDEPILQSLGVDVRGVMPPSSSCWKDHVGPDNEGHEVVRDRLGAIWTRSRNGYYFDQRPGGHPLADLPDLEALDPALWPRFDPTEWCEPIRGRLEAWRNQYVTLLGDPLGGILALGFRMRGYTRFYTDLARNSAFACGLMDQFTDLKIAYWETMFHGLADLIDIVVYEDDLGQQDRTLLSPKMYRELVKPRHRRLFRQIKKLAPDHVKIFMHSDGSLYDIIPDLIEVGVDILNPVQVNAARMSPTLLKREFGQDLVFWGGGADSQGVLSFGTPDEVREEARANIEALAPGGGYVFSSIHNIQPEVPPENVEAMLTALERHGRY